MRKTLAMLVFLLAFSISIFADGNSPGGGRQCGYEGVPPCLVEEPPIEDTIVNSVKEFLLSFLD